MVILSTIKSQDKRGTDGAQEKTPRGICSEVCSETGSESDADSDKFPHGLSLVIDGVTTPMTPLPSLTEVPEASVSMMPHIFDFTKSPAVKLREAQTRACRLAVLVRGPCVAHHEACIVL